MLRAEAEPGFFWGAFLDFKEGLERHILINLLWALQCVPGFLGLAFPAWPLALRSVLVVYSLVVIVPATAAVYLVLSDRSAFPLGSREAFFACARASLQTLAPLWVGLAVLGYLNILPLPFALTVVLRLFFLLALLPALYWGGLFAHDPARSPLELLSTSVTLVLSRPVLTLQLAAACLLTMLVAAVSIGGFFLASITLLTLFQERLLLELEAPYGNP